MLNVLTSATSAISRGFVLAMLSAAVGLVATSGFSAAQPNQAGAPISLYRWKAVQLAQATPSIAPTLSEREAVHDVLSSYYDTRDPAAALAFFGEPALLVLPNQVIALSSRADVDAFFNKLVESLKAIG